MKSFEIRQLFVTDLVAVDATARVMAASNQADGLFGAIDAETLAEELKGYGNREYVLVAYADGDVIGCADGMPSSDGMSIYVLPESRGIGVEEALLASLEVTYRLNGATESAAGIGDPQWRCNLLQDNGYRYRGDDMLVKDLSLQTVSGDRALWVQS